jgi:hypothetical protein
MRAKRFVTWMTRRLRVALLLVLSSFAGQASYLPPVWQQQIASSDFVGVVECERGGVGLCQVVVLEAWKGLTNGSRFNLQVWTDALHPQPELVLAGAKHLLLANSAKERGPSEMNTLGVPYRPTSVSRLSADLGVALFWRFLPLPHEGPLGGNVSVLTGRQESAAAFKTEVLRFLAQPPAAQEREVLQAVFVARLPRKGAQPDGPLKPEAAQLAKRVLAARTPEAVLRILLASPETAASANLGAGGAVTLRTLLHLEPGRSPLSPHVLRADVASICRLHPALATNLALRPKLSPADENCANDLTSRVNWRASNSLAAATRPRWRGSYGSCPRRCTAPRNGRCAG